MKKQNYKDQQLKLLFNARLAIVKQIGLPRDWAQQVQEELPTYSLANIRSVVNNQSRNFIVLEIMEKIIKDKVMKSIQVKIE